MKTRKRIKPTKKSRESLSWIFQSKQNKKNGFEAVNDFLRIPRTCKP